jgi:CubicO group peptidase (beta-lactamase class C family)
MAAVRPLIEMYMACHDVPNLSLAVADRSGNIVHCHGYTYLEAYRGGDEVITTTPWSTFRLASVTKMLTAIGIMQMAEAIDAVFQPPADKADRHFAGHAGGPMEKLQLDRALDWKVQAILEDTFPIWNNTFTDPDGEYAGQVTVRHLLCHQGGWVRDEKDLIGMQILNGRDVWKDLIHEYNSLPKSKNESFVVDPLSADWTIWKLGWSEVLPVELDTIREVVNSHNRWGQLLRPGYGGYYSNWGFVLAGKVLEQWSGMDFTTYIQTFVGGPVGANGIRFGHEVLREEAEVEYYCKDLYESTGNCPPTHEAGSGGPGQQLSTGIYLLETPASVRDYDCVRIPQGGDLFRGRPGWSGLTASAKDLILILADLANPASSRLLSATSIAEMMTDQSPKYFGGAYGLGWDKTASGIYSVNYKTGRHAGTRTLVAIKDEPGKWFHGLSICILTNCEPAKGADDEEGSQGITKLMYDVLEVISALASGTTSTTAPWGDYSLRAALAATEAPILLGHSSFG